jgi:hypothetical protein
MSRMHRYIQVLVYSDPTNRALIDTGGGYHLGALNFISDHSSFPSSILPFPLIVPPGLILNNSIN